MKRTTIFLDEGLERDLQGLARRQSRPVASLVREALEEYVADRRRAGVPLSFVGAGASGRSDVAERHEALLWRDRDPHGTPAPVRKPTRSRKRAAR
jgi:hypothetical protein